MSEVYIIEIVYFDNLGYRETRYFKGLYIDDYGIVKIETTQNPLEAKAFSIIGDSKSSIINVIKNSMKAETVKIKKLNVSVE